MSEEKDFPQDNKKGLLKTVILFFSSLLLLLAVLAGVLQIPAVQTKVVQKLAGYLSEKTGFPVQVERVHLRWFDALSLKGLAVYDQQDSLMIEVEETFVDFRLLNLVDRANPSLDELVLSRPKVRLLKNMPDSGLNINAFIRNLRELLPARTEGPKTYVPFTIHDVVLHDASFVYNDQHKDSLTEYFDYNHINLNRIDGQLSQFRVIADTIDFNIVELQARAPAYDFSVDSLNTFFRYTEQSMLFQDLFLKAGQSTIRDSLSFAYKNQEALEYFVDSVTINASLKESVIHAQDLAVFAPYFKDFKDVYYLSGKFNGPVRDFDASQIDLRLGQSQFKGELSMNGLPNFNETFIEAELYTSSLYPPDIRPYFEESLYENLKKFGTIRFSSQFLGFPNDFVANGTFNTRLGQIQSDINLKLSPNDHRYSTYSGSLDLQNFEIGQLIGEPDVQRISMKGNVKGSGFSLDAANLRLNANISQLGYRGYNYRNIVTNGQLAKRFFEGRLNVQDPNLQIDGQASIDLRNNQQQIKVKAQLDTAYLQALNLSREETFIQATIDLNISGKEIDELQGEAYLSNAYFIYEGRDLAIDTLSLFSAIDSTGRQLMVETDLLDLYAAGNFDYTTLIQDVQRLYKEYALNFRNQSEEIQEYYSQKQELAGYERYQIEYLLKLKDINPLIHLFEPELSISGNTELEGSFTGGYTSILSANTRIDTLRYKNDLFYQLEAELNTSKIADSTDVLAMAYLQSAEQQIEGITPTEGLVLEAIWDRDHINLSADIRQKNSSNNADLSADVFFLQDQTELSFHSSTLRILDNTWQLARNNRIIFQDNEIQVENFIIRDENQFLLAEGIMSQDSDKKLILQVDNFQLTNLNPILDQKLSGAINGSAELTNVFDTPHINGQVKVNEFTVDKFLVGDIVLEANWNNRQQYLDLKMNAIRQGIEVVSAAGYYNPFQEEDNLNVDATFYKTNLDIIEPFAEDIFSNIRGTVSGKVRISGTPSYPILRGGGNVENGQIKINYLNTLYTFDGGIVFTENEIGFRNLQIYDNEQNPATLNGGIFHDGFDNFIINLKGRLEGTKVLNTTYQDNELYYGTAYAIGDLEVLGPINNLQFIASARTAKGTKMFIPIDFSSDYQQQEYINYTSKKDTAALLVEKTENINISGIKLDFDLEITPDAYCEIIFDLRAGDIIRGRGNGKLDLQIDTEGEFTMFGDYEITKGAYNFTLFNVITKEFVIEPGSTIRWMGDPYGGNLNIQARYNQSASLLPILQRSQNQEPTAQERRPYPVTVQMDLQGELLSPTIDFDIDIRDYPAMFYSDVQRFRGLLATDEQYLNRQVFNLIVLRQLAPETNQNALGFGSQTAISSISELLSNQFSALATQIDENLEIDVDVSSSIDADAINTFQLRLSYTFLDGRLRITRDGSIASRSEQSDVNNLIGDWTIEYLLTPDGQYRVKMYSRNNMNQLNSTFNMENHTQGVSISQTKSFDSLRELFENQKKKQKNESIPIQDNSAEGLLKEDDLLHDQQPIQ